MKTTPPLAEYAAKLAATLPVEDIWMFEAAKAPESGFDHPIQFVLFVRDDVEPHQVEAQANALLAQNGNEAAAHAFPHAAIYQTPRPLVVKMAFGVGECLFQK